MRVVKKILSSSLFHLLVKICVIALAAYLLLTYVFGAFRLSGNLMYPALRDGDLCVTYRLEEYHSNDVVAYQTPHGIQFGRILARPGDEVNADESGVLINGSHPMEQVFYPTDMSTASALTLPCELGDGEYFILNDYREDARDSRQYGLLWSGMFFCTHSRSYFTFYRAWSFRQ